MTSIITWWKSDGSMSHCNAHCYNGSREAKWCQCVCGGENHGVGKELAIVRARAKAVAWLAKHPDIIRWTVAKIVTFRRPEWGTEDPRYFRSLNKNERYWSGHPNYQGKGGGHDISAD
jgi:hypothetical protein